MELLDPQYGGPRTQQHDESKSRRKSSLKHTSLPLGRQVYVSDMELLVPDQDHNEAIADEQHNQSKHESGTLPFGRNVPFSSVSGSTYATAQTLIQQVAYSLSDKIFSYSPETFDLDVALKTWQQQSEKNAWGYTPGIPSMETRIGAGSIALGYMTSPDFDMERRHIPQSIVASSGSLQYLRPTLTELSLLHDIGNPVALQISAADYSARSKPALITDYTSAMSIAEDIGLGLVSSASTFEAQHMSLLVTILASSLPSIHIYDGMNVGRETTRLRDVLSREQAHKTYEAVVKQLKVANKRHMSAEGKVQSALEAFNAELETQYRPFEYHGHPDPESVLVVFGSTEASIACQLADALGKIGARIGVVNVRIYRPFIEDEFLDVLPTSASHVAVLGQVKSRHQVNDDAERSSLYQDILGALSFSTRFAKMPQVIDVKYSREEVWTPSKMLSVLQHITQSTKSPQTWIKPSEDRPSLEILPSSVKRFSFWDVDDSNFADGPAFLAQLLAGDASTNVTIRTGHDNLAEGGVVRTDIRISAERIDAPYPVTASEIAFVGAEQLLKKFDVCANLKEGASVILKIPGAKDGNLEKLGKRLPAAFQRGLIEKDAKLYILDPTASSKASESAELDVLLAQLAFLKLAGSSRAFSILQKLVLENGFIEALGTIASDLEIALWEVDIPEDWATVEVDSQSLLSKNISANSFAPFDKVESEPPAFLKSWKTAAKGLVFKEATGQKSSLRPDVGVKTSIVHVKEHRRLTPEDYDRNVFHIEFDLGDSGLKYEIGEALGIHAENDQKEVEEFIKWYGLNPEDVVEVPSREDPKVLENRTVYQSLMQNIDIFGRPPKRFYEALAEFASVEAEKKELLTLGGPEGANEFKRRAEVDTITFADVLLEFPSAHPSFHDIVRIVNPMKRREYSIASSQKVTPTSVSLLIVTVDWVDPQGRDRFGQATRYMNSLAVGTPVTVSVKPSVMKLPTKTTSPLIMAGLGTGLAPFRAFVQERAWQKAQGHEIGKILLYMGSRHQREEYLYGEEWEAYRDAGIVTLLGQAFSRDQPQKIYIQDRMRQTLGDIQEAYLREEGSFYLCGPTWPVPDVTEVLQEAIEVESKEKGTGKKIDAKKEIEKFKDEARYVLEVY